MNQFVLYTRLFYSLWAVLSFHITVYVSRYEYKKETHPSYEYKEETQS